MITIAIHDAEFFACHGYYKEEQILGNRFVVSIRAGFDADYSLIGNDQLENTLNYEQLYNIAEEEMKQPRQLLETIANAIAKRILLKFAYVKELSVTVKKLNPPLRGRVRASSVTITYP